MALDRSNWITDVMKVGRAHTVVTIEGHQHNLVFNALSDR